METVNCGNVSKNISNVPMAGKRDVLKERVIFQGRNISLGELLSDEDFKDQINSETLRRLVQNKEMTVGLELPLNELIQEGCYIQRYFSKSSIVKTDRDKLDEGFICKSKEKMMLIEGIEGLGKSILFMNLAKRLKELNPLLWIIRIELNDYIDILENLLRNNLETVTVTDLLESKEATLLNQLEKFIFSMTKKVVLLLNVDEIGLKFINLVINLLTHCLLAPNFEKVLVSIRSDMVPELEANLQLTTYILQPFSEQDQVDFLTNYWTHLHENKTKIEKHARALLREMKWMISSYTDTEHVPVQFMMLAEVFRESFQSPIPEEFDVIKLYEMFMEKKRNDLISEGDIDQNRRRYEKCVSFYRTLAIETILDKEMRNRFLFYRPDDLEQMEAEVLKMGIVQKCNNGFRFMHGSVAEYFLGECLVRELQFRNADAEFQEYLLEQILTGYVLPVTCASFNAFFADHVDFLPFDIFQSYINTIKIRKMNVISLLSYLVWHGYIPILKLFFKSMEWQRITDVKDNNHYKTYNIFQRLTRYGGINMRDDFGTTPLHVAVTTSSLEMVKFLVLQGANVSTRNECGNTPLFSAVRREHFDTVKFLAEHAEIDDEVLYESCDKDRVDVATYLFDKNLEVSGNTVIAYVASFLGRLDVLERILNEGFDVNTKYKHDETLIFSAVKGEQLDVIKYLVQQGADVNSRNDYGETVLFFSSEIRIVKLLLQVGVDVNYTNSYMQTALHKAAELSQVDVVDLLVGNGADVHARDNQGWSALWYAIHKQCLDVARYLVKAGANVNARDKFQRTVLHSAVAGNALDSVKLLVECGADIDDALIRVSHDYVEVVEYLLRQGVDASKTTMNGETVLHLVPLHCHLDVIKLLLEYGVDVNTKDASGRTALFSAVKNGSLQLVVFLVTEGYADVNITDNAGRTALHFAALDGNLGIVQFLIERGVDVNAQDNEGCTAFHLAALQTPRDSFKFFVDEPVTNARHNAFLTVLKLLMAHGASIYDTDMKGNTPEMLARMDTRENSLVKCLEIWRIVAEYADFLQNLSKEMKISG